MAIWEAGFDFWSLAPGGDILAPLGAWLLLPFIARCLAPNLRAARWALGFALIVAAGGRHPRLRHLFDAGNPDPNEMPSDSHHFTAGS